MKDRILTAMLVLGVFALIGAGMREYLIHNGRLTSDLNADGHSITNLADGFFPTNGFYTKAETDAKIVELAPPPGNYGVVSNRALHALSRAEAEAGFTEWRPYEEEGEPAGYKLVSVTYQGNNRWRVEVLIDGDTEPTVYTDFSPDGENAVALTFNSELNSLVRTRLPKMSDFNGLASELYVDNAIANLDIPDPDLSEYAKSSELSEYAKLYTVAALANFATNADVKASTAIAYLQGDDAKVVITNYDSSVQMPSMSFQQRVEEDGSNIWRIVWNELTRWNWLTGTYLPAHYYGKGEVDGLLDGKADRAWGFYDSHTGGWAPDGYTWISSPKIAIAAGLAYQRTVTSGGAIWVLESNGLVTETGGTVSNGFFRISDDENNALFEIVKGNKRTEGAQAEQPAITNVMGIAHMYIRYRVASDEHPTLEVCADLLNPDWHKEDSEDCVANVSWSGASSNYVAEVWAKTAQPRMFVKATYMTGGETYIKNAAPISVQGGILCTDGIHKARPVYNNGNITWEVVR